MAGDCQRDVILQACGLHKVFHTGGGELEILKGVDLEVERGEMVSIMGASGVGKSTLLHILGALDRPTAGELVIRAVDVLSLPEAELASFRNRQVGFVFQFHHLLPEFSALENVLMPALIAGEEGEAVEEEAVELMRRVGLEERLHHRPGELSGGECQRVAIVRALIMKPLVVLADEPSGNLDEGTSEILHQLLKELAQAYNQAFVIMTHDRSLAESMDRVGHLEAGLLHI